MKTVFVVDRGTYETSIIGAYSTRENAELICKTIGADATTAICEWTLDESIAEIKKGYSVYQIVMLIDGEVERIDRREIDTFVGDANVFSIWKRMEAPMYKGLDKPNVLTATVWARGNKHAIKIADEKRLEMIANGEWK